MNTKRVLIHFPGTAGNMPFYFGVMDYIQHHIDLKQLAFLTRSGSGFPVATAINGVDCKSCLRNWQARIRSFYHETGNTTCTNIDVAIADHAKLSFVNAISNTENVPHHIETLTPPFFDRHWTSKWNTTEDYISSLLASSHLPFVFNKSFTRNGHIDGAVHIPFMTRSFGITGKVVYKNSILVKFEGYTYTGAVNGIFSPDNYIVQSDMEYQQGIDYASTILKVQLETMGVVIQRKPRIPPDTSNIVKWDTKTHRYIEGESPGIYRGPWWIKILSKL